MQKKCMDSYHTNFDSYEDILDFHKDQSTKSRWVKKRISELVVEPLDEGSSLAGTPGAFASEVSPDAVRDTVKHLGLAMVVDHEHYPVRDTAYKSLLERAKINGTALPKLDRSDLANVLNACLRLYPSDALLLFRDEKITAVHSGTETDYSVLPIDSLLVSVKKKLDERFPDSVFDTGYCDHSMASASWSMPEQKEELLGTYTKTLEEKGLKAVADRLMPGVRFMTSDTGIASAKISALLTGGQHPVHIGGCISIDHRHGSRIEDFENAMDQLFAKFGDSVERLQKLLDITLDYPVNAMTRVCKKLSMPKKAAVEAIGMFEMAYGDEPATAHDVFMAMQEIPFNLKAKNTPEAKMLAVEENLARALTLKWSDYDQPSGAGFVKGVDY